MYSIHLNAFHNSSLFVKLKLSLYFYLKTYFMELAEITTRRGTSNDLELLLEYSQKLFKYESKYTNTYNQEWTYSPNGRDYFTHKLTTWNNLVLFAFLNEKPVGYLTAFYADYLSRLTTPIVEVENIYVDEEYRNKGIGKLLFNECHKWSLMLRAKRFKVKALTNNEEAIAFYRKLGFFDFHIVLEKDIS